MGLKAKYEAGKITSKETSIPRDAKKVAGRLEAADPKRQQVLSAAEKEVEELLRAEVVLPFLKAAQPPAPRPAGSRKRAREPETDVIADAEADVLQAEKAVKRAAVAKEQAEQAEQEEQAKAKTISRITGKLEDLADAAQATTIRKQVKQTKLTQLWLKPSTGQRSGAEIRLCSRARTRKSRGLRRS